MKEIINKIINKDSKKKVIFILLSIVIIVFLITSIITVVNTIDFLRKSHSAMGVVVSVSENNDVSHGNYSYEIEFYDQYNNFTSSIVSSNKVYDIDDTIKLYYGSSNDIYLERRNPIIILIPIICVGIGMFLIFLLKDNYKENEEEKEKSKLLNNKNIVYARIENVECKDNDGQRVYNIVCSWVNPDDGENYTFYSEDLDFDPTMSIRISNKNSLNVHLDKNNYNNYVVDVNDIKNNRV